MKKLNTIISFVLLSFCLLINVSFAFEIMPNVTYTKYVSEFVSKVDTDISLDEDFITIVSNYYNEPVDYLSDFENAIKNLLSATGKSNFYISSDRTSNFVTFDLLLFNDDDWAYHLASGNLGSTNIIAYLTKNSTVYYVQFNKTSTSATLKSLTAGSSYDFYKGVSLYNYVYYLSSDVKNFNAMQDKWDGTTYLTSNFELSAPDNPDTPTMPSNSEIASAVQMFYNSVYNLPNIAFDDFVVLYDNTTNLYTYIGHTLDTALGQVIVEPNGYYEGYKYDVQWWKFFIDEQNDNFLDQFSNYYVYTSDGTIENLKYVGDSNISGLIEKSGPWATAKTVIVYSTNDYPVKYVTFSDDSPDPVIQTGTIQGDQYTYDENLDITDNQYNPLDNFISINYPSTLVGNADFDSFLNTFNENKDVLILPQNANWVILANNSLFSHFSSFIIMCTLFIILQRVMRG